MSEIEILKTVSEFVENQVKIFDLIFFSFKIFGDKTKYDFFI